ncbi:NAD-dependent protein deacetylase sirtuin-1 [Bufo gargarizans]|uniref:NAD-dependent protein deacetylase sirtuin-1 n=1 Tax=Bufo gargarizans TaxID=30331 RepID=UPI001CF3D62D|nr:NAD-dependent protein deacetylase sirtuin-1 [Bufo gargarizans]
MAFTLFAGLPLVEDVSREGGRAPPTSGCGKMADAARLGCQLSGSLFAVAKENGEPVAKKPRTEVANGGQPLPGESEGSSELSTLQEGEASAQRAAGVKAHNSSALPGLLPVDQRQVGIVIEEEEEEGAEELQNGGDLTDQAVDYGENLHLDDELAGGFHSCDSDEDDRASHASSSDWTPKPCIGPYTFVQRHLMMGTDPRTILKDLLPESVAPPDLDDMTLWQIVINILSDPPKRKKRKDINTIEDAVRLLQESKKIMVLTGAGVSVSCGIPDFRSRDGIYARLAVDFPDLPNPQAMFDIEYFRKDPRPFFKFAKEIFPGQFQPSLCHKFIAMLDKEGKLLRNYTQNIDTLEQVAGIQRIIQCHGSFAMASCLICKHKVDCEAVREDIFNQIVPHCPKCPPDEPLAIMKPDIVFFGENLPEEFHRAMKYDKDEVDLLIVIGSSLKVRPVALIPSSIPHEVPQILINREPLPHLHFDIELLGDCDVIINELCQRLGGKYTALCSSSIKLSEITEKPPRPNKVLLPETTTPRPIGAGQDVFSQDWLARPELPLTPPLEECQSSESESELSQSGPGKMGAGNANGIASITQLETSEPVSENPVSNDDDSKKFLTESSIDTSRKSLTSKAVKEQISKRLDGTQYLFMAPNRYIFHGAEVYSDSEEDLSSSSCGTNSDSESLQSPSLQEHVDEDSENEDFYRVKFDNDSDTEHRVGLEEESEGLLMYENNEVLGNDDAPTKL